MCLRKRFDLVVKPLCKKKLHICVRMADSPVCDNDDFSQMEEEEEEESEEESASNLMDELPLDSDDETAGNASAKVPPEACYVCLLFL